MDTKNIRLSVLDQSPVRKGLTATEAVKETVELAKFTDALGYTRFWVSEHHNTGALAGSTPEVLMAHLAGQTKNIRIGSGGIMMPNHSALKVAENFRMVEALFPGRIDLGMGRAPGTDQVTMRALRRNRVETEEDFPREVAELQQLLGAIQPGQRVIASPGANSHVPIWLLGSSLFSAQLAAQRGLPYAFASHFAPRMLMQAIDLYRSNFVPSAVLSKPRVVVGVPLVAAATDEEAQLLASSIFQRVSGIVRGERRALQAPVENYLETRDPQERAAIADFLAMAVIGGPTTVAEYLKKIIDVTEADELMLVCDIFDPTLRLRSLDIAAAAMPT